MKDLPDAWRSLKEHADSQLGDDFAGRVLRASHGPSPAAWRQLAEHGANRLRSGFAERVLRAVRRRIPTLGGQLAFGAAVAMACLITVIFLNQHAAHQQEEQNLAEWRRVATDVQYLAYPQ